MVASAIPQFTSTRRILAVWLPTLPTDRIERQRKRSGPRANAPLVLVAKTDNVLRLSAVNTQAARLGLVPDMAFATACAMTSGFDAIQADETADAKLLTNIADWCDRFTPLVALDPPHGLFLDVTGTAHLSGGEQALLDAVLAAFSRQGFAAQLALAGTAAAARALARYRPGHIVPPGAEAQAVADLPVEALELDPAIAHGLRRAGLKTIGQAAGRTRGELSIRFGSTLVLTLDRALGKAGAPISPRRLLPDYRIEHRFVEPVATQDIISATLRSLATSLALVMERNGEGARAIEAAFFRADGVVCRIAIRIGQPTRDVAVIERLFREKLDALADPLDPGFGFDLIRLEASLAERKPPEVIGLDTDDDADKDVSFLIDRLTARLGPHRVLRFRPQGTHIPEAAWVALPAQETPDCKRDWAADATPGEVPRRPIRLFAKPEPIEVMAEVPDGPPLRFRWRRALHVAARAEGPERIAMEWWRHQEAMPTRDYFRVEDGEGRRFWLYREGLYGRETERPRWFVHGVFA